MSDASDGMGSIRSTVAMLLAHSKGATQVSLEEILEIAAMPADELRRRAIVGRDWHRLFAKCLDAIPELQPLGGSPDGCWMPRDIRRVVMRLLNKPGDARIPTAESTQQDMAALIAAQISEARRLMSEALVLLRMAGAEPAVRKTRAALACAESASLKRPRKDRRAPALPGSTAAMPKSRSQLFRRDGTLRFVMYMKAAGRRPAVIAVNFRVPGLQPLTTTFTLAERDFDAVYETAVKALAKHVGVLEEQPLVGDMLATAGAFRRRYIFVEGGHPHETIKLDERRRV